MTHQLQLMVLLCPLPEAGAWALAKHPDTRIRCALAATTTVPEVVAQLARDRDQQVRRTALPRWADGQRAGDALRNGTAGDQVGAAANPAVAPRRLAGALLHNSSAVRRAAFGNPSTPLHAVLEFAAHPRAVLELSSSVMDTFAAAAAGLAAHRPLLGVLAGSQSAVLRRLVARELGPHDHDELDTFLAVSSRSGMAVLAGNTHVGDGAAATPALRAIRASVRQLLGGGDIATAVADPAVRTQLAALGAPAVDAALMAGDLPLDDVADPLAARAAVLDPDVAAAVSRSGWAGALAVRSLVPISRVRAAAASSPLLQAALSVPANVAARGPAGELNDLPALVAAVGEDPVGWQVVTRLAQESSRSLDVVLRMASAIAS